jgi:hypothetical protein
MSEGKKQIPVGFIQPQRIGQQTQCLRSGTRTKSAFEVADGARTYARLCGELILAESGACPKSPDGSSETRRRSDHHVDSFCVRIQGWLHASTRVR